MGTPVRDTVDSYSWDELADIADQIAQAGSDFEGLQVASKFHLCGKDGKLDENRLKSFTLADGTQVQTQIVGFRHDDRADGSGKAGITFMTKA